MRQGAAAREVEGVALLELLVREVLKRLGAEAVGVAVDHVEGHWALAQRFLEVFALGARVLEGVAGIVSRAGPGGGLTRRRALPIQIFIEVGVVVGLGLRGGQMLADEARERRAYREGRARR